METAQDYVEAIAELARVEASEVVAAAYGSARGSSSFFVETKWRGETTQPCIALTFDDGAAKTGVKADPLSRER